MKIKCIDSGGIIGLTENKIYTVIKESQLYYIIKNDNNNKVDVFKYRFVIATSHKRIN